MSLEGRLWVHKKAGLIYLSGEINEEACSFIARALYMLSSKEITLYINSGGGEDSAGFALYDLLTLHMPQTTAVIVGACESAALLPFVACERRFMTENSYLKIHHGTLEIPALHQREAVVDAQRVRERDDIYMNIIAKRTGMDIKMVKRHARFGKYYDAESAIKFGLSHKTIDRTALTQHQPAPKPKAKSKAKVKSTE